MIYQNQVKLHAFNSGEIIIIGIDGVTFIATIGHGEEAQEIAQHIVNLWNLNIKGES